VYNNKRNLRKCARYMLRNTINLDKSHHVWINEIKDVKILGIITDVKRHMSIELQDHLTNYTITNIPEMDEIYYSVSPHNAKLADTSLVKPHYDGPFGGLYTDGALCFRVIVACNKNDTVYTRFSNQISHMDVGDFHAFDFNNDLHSTEGAIPKGKQRVLLKLHYAVIPKHKNIENIYELPSTHINIMWTKLARYFMHTGSSPTNWIEFTYGPITEYLIIANNFRMQLSKPHSLQ
jgi:hypothetical protein